MCLKTGAVCVAKAISLERRPSWRRLTSWSFGDARGDHFRYCQVGSRGLQGRRWSAAATLTEKKNRKKTANGEQRQGLATGNYRAWFQWRSTNLSRYLRFQPCSIISDQSRALTSSCSPRLCSPMSLKDDAFGS